MATQPRPVYFSFTAPTITDSTVEKLLAACSAAVTNGATSIHLALTTFGGNVPYAIAALNALMALPVPLTTYNTANVGSSGNLIFLAGERRIMSRHATFFFHPVSITPTNSAPIYEASIAQILEDIQRQTDTILQIVTARTGMSLDQARILHARETTLKAEESLALGIAHQIDELRIPHEALFHQIITGA